MSGFSQKTPRYRFIASALFVSVSALWGAVPSGEAKSKDLCCGVRTFNLQPDLSAPAPLNTRIRLLQERSRAMDESSARLSLFRIGESGEVTPVPAEEHQIVGPLRRLLELVPKERLAPRTLYMVEYGLPQQRERIGTFMTGDSEDRQPPSWSGVQAIAPRCIHDDPGASLAISGLRDDATAQRMMMYGIWVQGREGRPDFSQPPTLSLFPTEKDVTLLDLRSHENCHDSLLPLPGMGPEGRVWVRAVDLAGHMGQPNEVILPLRSCHKLRPKRRVQACTPVPLPPRAASSTEHGEVFGVVQATRNCAPLAGVTVVATNPMSGREWTEFTDAKGFFVISHLPPGEGYVLTLYDNSSTTVHRGLHLRSGQPVTLPLFIDQDE